MVNVTHDEVIKFIQRQIIYRYGILETIATDQGTMFTREKVVAFAQQYRIKMIHSSPYYAQTNGQAEATNKIIIDIIKRNIEENLESGMTHYMKHCGLIGIPKQLRLESLLIG